MTAEILLGFFCVLVVLALICLLFADDDKEISND